MIVFESKYSLLAILLLWSFGVACAQNYGRHGLFWSGLPNFNASISENTNWQSIPGATLAMALDAEKKTLISYEISVEGLRRIDGSPLPRESNTDSLQVRCVIDGVPLRHSSSVATTYLVEQRMITTLASTFAASMSADNHTITLQWKKTGTQLEKWVVQTGGVISKFTVTAQADFDAIDHLHESTDEFLYTSDVWKPLSNNLTFHVNKERVVTIGYAFTVQPQLASFVKDRTMEYLMARLSVDGISFVESAETFGTNGWNPQSHVLKGSVRLKLGAGQHVVQLLWRKRGNIFKSWGSNPSSMDGFACSRNVYVLIEKFDPPTFVDHERHISPVSNQWATVGSLTKNVLTFNLIKESAVLLTYALPVTQYENPNFDSNSWDPLAAVDSRLVVDDVAYTFQGGDSVRRGSREFSSLFGNLALVLPAGSHTVSLQWRSDGFSWTTLNDLAGGFSHGEKLLAFVTSENALPVISSPPTVYGTEDVVLVVPGVRIDDIDDLLAGGVTLDVNITVSTGLLAMPNAALLANPLEYSFGVDHSTIRMTDSIASINAALMNFTYTAPQFWNGEDTIVISTSDLSQTGNGASPKTDLAHIKVIIRPVDNMFTLDLRPVQSLPNVGANQPLAPITLTDIDSQDAYFRVQLSAICGVLSFQAPPNGLLTFFAGDGVNDTAMDFQGPYDDVRNVLLSVLYSPDSSCNQAVHQESVTVRVTDVRNPAHDLTRLISINTIRQNAAPEILSRANPRWTVDGLLLETTTDTASSAVVNYTQYPAGVKSTHDLTQSSLLLGNQNEAAELSSLSVLHTDNVTYALSMQFQTPTEVVLRSSNYIQAGSTKRLEIFVPGEISAGVTTVQCIFGVQTFAAELDRGTNIVSCLIQHLQDADVVEHGRNPIEWVKVVFSGANSVLLESNYLPIFVSPPLDIVSAQPLKVLRRSVTVVRVRSSAPGVAQVCLFDNQLQIPAVVQKAEILCKVPDLGANSTARNVSLRIASADLHFQSKPVTLTVLAVPTLTKAYTEASLLTSTKSLVVEGEWNYEAIEAAGTVYCLLNGEVEVPASATGASQVHCPLASRNVRTNEHRTVALRFGEQVTNEVSVTAAADPADDDHFTSFDVHDTFANAATESGFLTVIGDFRYIPIGKDITCTFDGSMATAPILVDDFTVLCPIPAGSSGSFALGKQVLLENFTTALGIVRVPMLERVTPMVGSVFGGAEVSIFGSGFSVIADVHCRFGKVSVPALIVSETHISCVAPLHHPGSVTLSVIVDNVFAMSNAPQMFTYDADPMLFSTSPSAGPLGGGTEILVSGTGFETSAGSIRCHFGDISVPAVVESDTQLSCTSPTSSESGTVSFTVRSSHRTHPAGALTFRYLDPIALTAVYPNTGAVGAETVVLVRGAGFVPQAGTMCLFGTVGVAARVVSTNSVECTAPIGLVSGAVDVGVAIEGYVQQSDKLTFTYHDMAFLSSVSPIFGPPHGGTIVTVLGTGFPNGALIECQFGAVRVPASRLSASAVACTSPANNVSVVGLALVIDDNRVASTYFVEFNYVRAPSVTDVLPAAGAVAGGTIVSVTGAGFSSPNLKDIDWDVFCQFGDKSTIAAVQSDSELTCLAPAATTVGEVHFIVAINGLQENAPAPVLFRYLDPIVITHIVPAQGSALGSEPVVIRGMTFPVSSRIECAFGIINVPARILNDSAVECITPVTSSGQVSVSVKVNGYQIPDCELPFSSTEPVRLTSLAPTVGSALGGTNVTIVGSGFTLDATLLCLFGDRPVSAVYLSETSIRCVAPAHVDGEVMVLVLDGSAPAAASDGLVFMYAPSPVLMSLVPAAGPIQGGTAVVVTGSGFHLDTSVTAACMFGSIRVEANVDSTTSLRCVAPVTSEPSVVDVSVLWNHGEDSNGHLSFRYLMSTLITSATPARLTRNSNTPVLLAGSWLPMGAQTSCLFADAETAGRVLNETTVECAVPKEVAGTVPVTLKIDGYVFPHSVGVFIADPVNLYSTDVSAGTTAGGTNVTILGAGFSANADIYCLFGDRRTPALFLSTETLICSSPPHSAGEVTVSVVVDTLVAQADVPIKYHYTSSLQLTSISPSTGPLSGASVIVVQGGSFLSDSSLFCAFGPNKVEAKVKTDTMLECIAPPSMSVGENTVEIRVVTAGGDESLSGLFYRYISAAHIIAVEPSHGSVDGGDVVLIRGLSIPASDNLWCFFGEQKTKAILISNTIVECATPAALEGKVSVGLLVSGLEVRNKDVHFMYHMPTVVTSSSPASGALRGNTNITITGTGFALGSDITCWFGAKPSPAVFMSSTTIECNSPAHVAGSVALSVTINDVIATSENTLQFHFVASPQVTSVAPSAGALAGGTTVRVSGTGFSSVHEADLQCKFGEHSVGATVIDDLIVECVSPTGDAAGLVELTLSVNEAESSTGSVYYRYLQPILVDTVYPQYGSAQGGEDVTILGAGFVPMASAKCHFGDEIVEARVLNTSAVVCTTPASSGTDTVALKISFEGQASSESLLYSYIPLATVRSVEPPTGTTVGATVVTVTGTGFLSSVQPFCVFDDVRVPATYVSEAELACSTLPHAAGSVEFSVLLGKSVAEASTPIMFSFIAAPVVTSLSPAAGGIVGDMVLSIAGRNFAEQNAMQCVFGGSVAPAMIISDVSAMCKVPDLSSIEAAAVSVEVRHAGEIMYSALFDVLGAATVSPSAISPKFLPLSTASVVQISGQQFHPTLAYTCQFAGHPVASAIVVTDSVLVCPTPSVDAPGQSELLVSQAVLGAIASYPLTFLSSPKIMSASTVSGNIHLHVQNVHPEISWRCVVDGVASAAIVASSEDVICQAPVIRATNEVDLGLRAVDAPFAADVIKFRASFSGNSDGSSGDTSCTVLPVELSSFRNDPSAPFATNCVAVDNSTMNPIQKRLIDQNLWFKNSGDLPPRDMTEVLFDYANLPSTEESAGDAVVFTSLFADTLSSSCAIDANTSCYSAATDAPLDALTVVGASSTGAAVSCDKPQQGIVVLHSVDPYIIDSTNGSWVTVSGRGFTNASTCTLGNASSLLSVFESPTTLQCWLPSLNEAQQLFVEVSVTTDGGVAVNSLPLVYKFLTSGELKPFIVAQPTDVSASVPTISMTGTYCASKDGCEVPIATIAANLTWATFLDATEFGETNFSYSAVYSTSNEQMIKRREVLSGLSNLTHLAAADFALIDSVSESVAEMVRVLVMNPSKFDLSVNRTDNVVHFLGAGFSPTSEWCMQVEDVVTECFAQSVSSLVCTLPNQHAPGVFDMHLLNNCSTDSSVFSSRIEFYYSLSQTKAADVVATPLLDVGSWHADLTLVTIKPLGGSVDGLTKVVISGTNLQNVHSCTFKFNDQLQYTAPAQLSGLEIACVTPAVSRHGQAEVELNLLQGTTVSTGVFFKFTDEPEVSFLSTSEALDDEMITVFGNRFPTTTQSFCKITFSSGQSMLTAAHTASSTMLTCVGASRDAFHGRVVRHVAVSFNGQDFIDAYGSSVLAARDSDSHLSLAATAIADLVDPFGTSVRAQQLSNSLAVNAPIVTMSCDADSSVVVNVPRASQTLGSTCVFNGIPTGDAKFLSATQMRCTMPVSAPGLYELTVQHPVESLLLPSLVLVQCLPHPKILSARLLPQVLRNGASELRFAGLNFHADLPVRCRVNIDWKLATTNSPYELGCNFDAMVPGMKEIALELNGRELVSYKLCFSVEMLTAGGSLTGPCSMATCSDHSVTRSPAPPKSKRPAIVREIRSFTPRSGLTMGKTPLEIIADGIDYGNDLSCKFGKITVPAVVISPGRVLCYSPPQSPQNVSVALVSADGQWTWNGGWFFYHPVVKILGVSPSLLDRSGGTIIVVDLQSALPDAERLYCHVHSQVLFANRIGNSTVSCVSPPILVASTVSVSVGSQQEIWSNGIEIAVSDPGEESTVWPSRGSLEGNTLVQIAVPASVHQMVLPTCWFGSMPASVTVWAADHANTLQCVAPAGALGQVDVQIMDDAVDNGMSYFAGVYTYEIPADITTITPSFVNQGEATELTVFGSNLHDSPSLSCVIHGATLVPAKWLSSQVVMCAIDKIHTVAGHDLTIQLSNNILDMSTRVEILQVVTDNMITHVGPLAGFASGNTEISIKFRTDYLGSLRCRFGGLESTSAYQVNSVTYTCVAPRFQEGVTTLEIVDTGDYVLAVKEFEYLPLPIINAAALPSVLAHTPARVSFSGANLHPAIVGRFRSAEGAIVPGKCAFEASSEELLCEGILATSSTSTLSLDLSVNGLNFEENFATVQVFEPLIVSVVDPLFASEAGGNVLHFSVDRFQAGFPTECVFTVGDVRTVSPSVLTGELSSSCVTPTLPLGVITTWSIQQADKVLFGPSELVVIAIPVISAVTPTTFATGVLSTVKISFLAAVFEFPAISCMFQGIPYDLKLTDSLSGMCTVHAAHAGEFELSLHFQGTLLPSLPVSVLTVVDATNDFSLSSTYVTSFAPTNVTVSSKDCAMPPVAHCSGEGAMIQTASRTDCELVCTIGATQNKDVLRVDICTTALCLEPSFSSPLNVIGSIAILAITPAKGPVQGGQQVLLYGADFEHDATLMCAFGERRAPMTVLSATRALCTAPPAMPGVHPVSIMRRNLVVSTSVASYEYLPLLSNVSVTPSAISALGGTEVICTTQDLNTVGPYYCRFNDKYVPALVVGTDQLSCQSPSFDVPTVTFALSIDNSDISSEKVLTVTKPPAVFFIDPTFFPAQHVVTVSAFLEESDQLGALSCKLNGDVIESSLDGSALQCRLPGNLLPGEHTISLEQGDVEFFTFPVHARPSYSIQSVSPLASFASSSTSVIIKVTQHMTNSEFSMCCFGDHQTPASLLSSTEWQCFTPTIQFQDLLNTHHLPVGLARADGFCEYFGFEFTFYNAPKVLSASPKTGSVAGGTPVTITFDRPLEMEAMYCRVGLTITLGQIMGDKLQCATPDPPVGVVGIEVSSNGVDFTPTGQTFEYLPIIPSFVPAGSAPGGANPGTGGDPTVPTPLTDPPTLFFVEPTKVSTLSQSIVTVKGDGFRPGATCLLGAENDPSRVALPTTYISSSEVQCTLPVHAPGTVPLAVQNIGSLPSASTPIEFVLDPALNNYPEVVIEPDFGPKRAETFITVFGRNLAIAGTDLLCLIGEEWSYAVDVANSSLRCIAPSSSFSGKVPVRVGRLDHSLIAGSGLFEYIEDPVLFDVQPARATRGTDLLVTGIGFLRSPSLTCVLGDTPVTTTVLSNTQVICQVPLLTAGLHSVTLNTNGQHFVRSGLSFQFLVQTELQYLWPLNGPALRGGTILSIHGQGFVDNIDMHCMVDMTLVPAIVQSEREVQCRLPPHKPGYVNVSLIADGALLHPQDQNLQFLYAPDVSVDKITPEFGYTSGDYPVFVFGSNFVNSTSLGCKFADMKSRGLFLSNVSIVCLSPSPLGRPELARLDAIPVEVTINGLDYSESGILFAYSEPCDQGFFCAGSGRSLCPNGTYCPENSRNFTLCAPGFFQPREGQTDCVICPVGYICPDQGMSRPVNCPPGLICDSMGLRSSAKLCPNGHYCLNNTKSSTVQDFENSTQWNTDYVTGVVSFNASSINYAYIDWPAPAVGKSRPTHPPEFQCDGLVCAGGTTNVLAEAPFPCPIGHYCRAGVGTQIPMPKNFSSPQRCYDGFFCPRGSVSPEGKGPCPNGFFCPTQLDAIICPQGHYCPGVGNTAPVECYPGTYNPFEGRGNCTVCPTGYICPSWGTLLPEPCPAGFVCMALGLSYPVVLCPAGYRCSEGTLTMDPAATTKKKPVVCAEAQFCLGGVASSLNIEWISTQPFGATQPQLCAEGTYCQAGAYLSSGSGLCFQGHYCPPDTAFPIETPVGNFASGLGSVAPTLCYPGTYAPLKAQVDCLVCPSGHTCISYGTYIPTICLEGTYRSQVDSVTCTQCPTGTYSYEVGGTDLTVCLPCPKGRICGIKRMTTLKESTECPPGYICGYGTDRSSQFAHLTPAGFHTVPNTVPEEQYSSPCPAGFYCPRGTPTYAKNAGKCPVGSYCPLATPAAVNADTKCPKYTSSLSQAETLQSCRIAEVNVCDKLLIDETDPMEDLTYYAKFEYDLLDDTGDSISFDSSMSATNPTGEVQVVKKIHPTNFTSSSPMWVNDTVEAFRACPMYGSGAGGDKIIIIGRNFKDTKLNYCRFRACYYANSGSHPRRCQNQITSPTGEDLRRAGNVSEATIVQRARYISPTRIECPVPEYIFESDYFEPDTAATGYSCEYVNYLGESVSEGFGNYSYVRACTGLTCADQPRVGSEYFMSLTFRCSAEEILAGICAHKPELNYMFNPCMSTEVLVEVTNDGEHYSGGEDLDPYTVVSTVRYFEHDKKIYNNFKNFTFLSTFAIYNYVHPKYFYKNPEIMDMERSYCVMPRYSEELPRLREDGYFQLKLAEVAHVQINLEHLPDNLVYDQHYRIAIFIIPSRCTVELCSSARVRLSPEEFTPCRKPKELSYWFQQTNVPKNVKNNITIFALDDLLFKVEIHILHGLYLPYAPLFTNTTTVRIASPSRTRTATGEPIGTTRTRQLSKYISFEERKVEMQFFYVAVYYLSDVNTISQALNMPPRYKQYERGRALIMNNRSSLNNEVPLVLDAYADVNLGTGFWLMPSTTSDQSKELLDAYFETFHETTYKTTEGYVFDLQQLALPYLPYFSNCDTFDSYIPIWLLLEGDECKLPDIYPKSWPRYKFAALPDLDHMKVVGPFSFFEDPIADWCERTVKCHYEEELFGQDNTPRWFEAETGTALFNIIRVPFNYYEYTGRSQTSVSQNDAGGGKAIADLQLMSGDNFIAVTVDRSIGDMLPGCIVQCFARSYLLEITYFQETLHTKRIVSASLIGDLYDFNQDDSSYELQLSYYPLGFVDLVLNFAYPLSIFMIIFVFLGFLTVLVAFIGWAICRATTLLQNPPQIKIMSMLVLILPPPLAGVTMAVSAIWLLTSLGNWFINGELITDPNSPVTSPVGSEVLDDYPLNYGDLETIITDEEKALARIGRIGSVFMIVGFCCFISASRMYFPKDETKRELEVAKLRTALAHKDLWNPVQWKKANFMFCSFVFASVLVLVVELSYADLFGLFIYEIIVMLIIFGEVFKMILEWQLNDAILVAPLNCGWNFISQLVTFGSPDFLAFLLSYFLGVAMQMFQRVFQKVYIEAIFAGGKFVMDGIIELIRKFIPRYMNAGSKAGQKAAEALDSKDYRRREVDGVAEAAEESDSVEPILDYFGDVCSDMMILVYFPFFVYLLMQYREQVQIPILYGIRQSDMMIYLVFQLFVLFAQPFADIFHHSMCELFHGWKIYEYLVYSRYRFLQRETRWKSMENSLDECIEEGLRRLDQMCFSSQYYLMLTVQVNGIIYVVFAYECWLRSGYSPFSDSAFFMLLAFLLAMYALLQWAALFLAIRLKLWKIKHENTAWHMAQREEDDLDIPAWEEIKGASTDAYLMNQRITSETFRYKFLNYNRTWLINQLPQLLTPRTMRRSRPYLINQFARIINARRDDISDDSDADKDKKFGPVALTAPSRNIVRWWLGKARRRIKLRTVVDPLIKRARGAQCEQCLSRKQLQIEYEIDVDKMAEMYDNIYPGDEEVDQVQWKQFWINNQRYHTICLACLTRRKEIEAREAMKGAVDPSMFDDGQEEYPDWGPVFLTAASKAMLLNWYRKAQRLRAGKRGNKRKDKVLKAISDDEGEDLPKEWLHDMPAITAATKAIAVKWMRTARARLQKKHGKGAGLREAEVEAEAQGAAGETFRSGRKSKTLRK